MQKPSNPHRWAAPGFILKVELDEVTPRVWRKMFVPGSITLDRLHHVLQVVMGWSDAHAHSFTINNQEFTASPEGFGDVVETGVVLGLLLHAAGAQFKYTYDVGDDWRHTVTLDSIEKDADRPATFVACLGGAGRCPPEDVGGPEGYAEFLRVMGDPRHPEHETYLEWAGGPFDPNEFDAAKANSSLANLGLMEWTHLERLTETRSLPFEQGADAYPGGFTLRDEANAMIALAMPGGIGEARRGGLDRRTPHDEARGRLTDPDRDRIILHACRMLANLLRLRDASPDLYQQYIREAGTLYCQGWEREN